MRALRLRQLFLIGFLNEGDIKLDKMREDFCEFRNKTIEQKILWRNSGINFHGQIFKSLIVLERQKERRCHERKLIK